MADHVLPAVRLLFACDDAIRDDHDEKWVLKHPWSTVMLPEGATFPFLAEELYIFALMTDGVGTFDLRVELWQVGEDGRRRFVGQSAVKPMTFRAGDQLLAFDEVFKMRRVPFQEAGLYRFRVIAELGDGGQQPLAGTTLMRLLDRRETL
jgi:hypothetical protein